MGRRKGRRVNFGIALSEVAVVPQPSTPKGRALEGALKWRLEALAGVDSVLAWELVDGFGQLEVELGEVATIRRYAFPNVWSVKVLRPISDWLGRLVSGLLYEAHAERMAWGLGRQSSEGELRAAVDAFAFDSMVSGDGDGCGEYLGWWLRERGVLSLQEVSDRAAREERLCECEDVPEMECDCEGRELL